MQQHVIAQHRARGFEIVAPRPTVIGWPLKYELGRSSGQGGHGDGECMCGIAEWNMRFNFACRAVLCYRGPTNAIVEHVASNKVTRLMVGGAAAGPDSSPPLGSGQIGSHNQAAVASRADPETARCGPDRDLALVGRPLDHAAD